MREPHTLFVLLCGGVGSRLWPLSGVDRPKQTIPFIDGKTLLDYTLDRVFFAAAKNDEVGVVTTQRQFDIMPVPSTNKFDFCVCEPASRDTAAAIALSCLRMKKYGDPVVAFIPIDHFIPDTDAFKKAIDVAVKSALESDNIILLGIKPDRPETGYGYINIPEVSSGDDIFKVKKFLEKPGIEEAKTLFVRDDVLWNSGMFIGRLSVFLREIQLHTPKVWSGVVEFSDARREYNSIPKKSFDREVLEKSETISVLRCNFEWSDVGTLDRFVDFANRYSDGSQKKIISDQRGNIAHVPGDEVIFLGVDNICVVRANGVLVILNRSKSEMVKDLARQPLGAVHL